jgi:hypothetical protein
MEKRLCSATVAAIIDGVKTLKITIHHRSSYRERVLETRQRVIVKANHGRLLICTGVTSE